MYLWPPHGDSGTTSSDASQLRHLMGEYHISRGWKPYVSHRISLSFTSYVHFVIATRIMGHRMPSGPPNGITSIDLLSFLTRHRYVNLLGPLTLLAISDHTAYHHPARNRAFTNLPPSTTRAFLKFPGQLYLSS